MSPDIKVRLLQLAPEAKIRETVSGLWMETSHLDVMDMAVSMVELGARLSTITGIALQGGETELIYHYVLGQTAFNIKTHTTQNAIASIARIVPAADWIEREIHDLYAVDFSGHPNLERFIRPPELPEGLFREPGGEAGKRLRGQAASN